MNPSDVADLVRLWPEAARPAAMWFSGPDYFPEYGASMSGQRWLESHPPETQVTFHCDGDRVICQRVSAPCPGAKRAMRQHWGGSRLLALHEAVVYVAKKLGEA